MSECFIYIIGRIDGPVKVGISSSPYGRTATLQTGCPFPIRLLHAVKCQDRREALRHEQSFHEVCEDKRLLGEWFDMDADHAYEVVNTGFEIEEHFAAQ